MSEQELYMMGEERAKDEIGAQNMMKKHQTLEHVVEDYADVVRQLGEKSRNLIDEEHPERFVLFLVSWFMRLRYKRNKILCSDIRTCSRRLL